MAPHLWIIESLDLFGVAENIKSLLVNSMEKCKVMLCSGNSELGEVEIKRGIFQGDSLLFILALILPVLILRKAKAVYEFSESKVKINLLFMDDLKLYSQSEKGLDSLVQTVRVFSEDVPPRLGNTGLVSSRDTLTSWREGASLALIGHPSSDGITIKMPYGVDVSHQPAYHAIFSYWVG